MNSPLDLIKCMFEGVVAGAQGCGNAINAAFQSVLYGVTYGAEGAVTYGSTYTDLSQFLFTIGGLGVGIGMAYFFLRLVKRRGH